MNYNVLRYFSVLAQVEHDTVAAARCPVCSCEELESGAVYVYSLRQMAGTTGAEVCGDDCKILPGDH